jgi:hypothetical protein
MSALPAACRPKFAKLLGLLGSDHQGERDAAALAAHRLVMRAGLSWEQIITPAPVEKALPELGTWRETVAECLSHAGSLRRWVSAFSAICLSSVDSRSSNGTC